MGKRVADQHAVMDRGWEHADELAEVVRVLIRTNTAPMGHGHACAVVEAHDALRRYEKARQS